jgi:hypothetical protein
MAPEPRVKRVKMEDLALIPSDEERSPKPVRGSEQLQILEARKPKHHGDTEGTEVRSFDRIDRMNRINWGCWTHGWEEIRSIPSILFILSKCRTSVCPPCLGYPLRG